MAYLPKSKGGAYFPFYGFAMNDISLSCSNAVRPDVSCLACQKKQRARLQQNRYIFVLLGVPTCVIIKEGEAESERSVERDNIPEIHDNRCSQAN